jgi:hypothetical protein
MLYIYASVSGVFIHMLQVFSHMFLSFCWCFVSVLNVCYKCFSCFKCMLQVFHLNLAKVAGPAWAHKMQARTGTCWTEREKRKHVVLFFPSLHMSVVTAGCWVSERGRAAATARSS